MIPRSRSSRFKLPFLEGRREWVAFGVFLVLVCGASLGSSYAHYRTFVSKPVYDTHARVLQQYEKQKGAKRYTVFKLQGERGEQFFTTQYGDLLPMRNRIVKVRLLTKGITFLEFLRGFYAPALRFSLLHERPPQYALSEAIAAQHEHWAMQELYVALFLGNPPSGTLRDAFNRFGIAHIIAISGFHLTLLGGILFGLLYWPYRVLQQRFFPWRNRTLDLGLTVIVLLGVYHILAGYVPSLVRAFGMGLVGFFFYMRGIWVLSFQSLLITVAFLLALLPSLLFSIGFWFSVAGVFYIFLFLHHAQRLHPWLQAGLLNLFVFAAMLPLVHYFFPMVSPLQLLSPLLTLLSVVVFPLELGLHLLGWGGLLDEALLAGLELEASIGEVYTPLWLLVAFTAISLGAIYSRRLFWATIFVATLFVGFLQTSS